MASKQSTRKNKMFTANALTWDKGADRGHILPVSCSIVRPCIGVGKLYLHGTMGETMVHSMRTAVTLARHTMAEQVKHDMYKDTDIYVCIPDADDYMYDGVSAGLATFIAVIGAMNDWKTNPRAALTGEVTANGQVLKVGALVKKLHMAADYEIDTVMFPKDNVQWEKVFHPKGDGPIAQAFAELDMNLIGIGVANNVFDFTEVVHEEEHGDANGNRPTMDI